MTSGADLATTLRGRSDLVSSGVTLDRLPAILDAREATDGGCWRLLCPASVVDALSTRLVLGTTLAESVERGIVAVRTTEEPAAERVVFAGAEETLTLAGPPDDRTLLRETDPERVDGLSTAAAAWFDRASPATVGMPSRSELIDTAGEMLSPRFADDLAAALDAAGPQDLTRDREVSDLTLLVALAARHDHLFRDVRVWADETGVVTPQAFTDVRRALVDRGLVETIKVPMGLGHPRYRLRAVDDALSTRDPAELADTLRSRFSGGGSGATAAGSSTTGRETGTGTGTGTGTDADRPVWDRDV